MLPRNFCNRLRLVSSRHFSASAAPLQATLEQGPKYEANVLMQKKLWEEVHKVQQWAESGGGEKAKAQHVKRKKMLPRDRITNLVDKGEEPFEICALAGYNLYKNEDVPAGGLICSIGKIHGTECMIIANDATVKGGTYYPITVKKNLRAMELAIQCKLPCVFLVDSGGAFLPMQSEIFADRTGGGRMFYNEAVMSRDGIPQIAAVMGSCTAGGAYAPAMTDECVIVRGTGAVYLGGPPLVKAATGEIVTSEELGGADVHCKLSGLTDHLVTSDQQALDVVRDIVANINYIRHLPQRESVIEPLYSSDSIAALLPLEAGMMRHLIARIVDGSMFHEFKPLYGPTLVTGFARLNGLHVGIIANDGLLGADACLKGAHFVELCSQRDVPILFLTNVSGFINGGDGKELKESSKMIAAISCSTCPKINLIVGDAFGPASFAMCPRTVEPELFLLYPGSQVGGAHPNVSIPILSQGQDEEMQKKIVAAAKFQVSSIFSSARCFDDGIINPVDTRKVLAKAIDIVSARPNIPPRPKYSVIRM